MCKIKQRRPKAVSVLSRPVRIITHLVCSLSMIRPLFTIFLQTESLRPFNKVQQVVGK